MSGLGKTLQLVQHDHEAEMQVGARRIDPQLHAQRTPGFQPFVKVGRRLDVIEAVQQIHGTAGAHVRSSISVTPVEPSSSLP